MSRLRFSEFRGGNFFFFFFLPGFPQFAIFATDADDRTARVLRPERLLGNVWCLHEVVTFP